MKKTAPEKIREKKEVVKKEKRILKRGKELLKNGVEALEKKGSELFASYSNMLVEELDCQGAGTRLRIKLFFYSLALAALAVVISAVEMGQDCYPLAISVFCASGCSTQKGFFARRPVIALALASVSISTLFMGGAGVLYFSILLTSFIIRSVLTYADYSESSSVRVLVSFFVALVTGAFGALISDFSLLSLVSWATLVTVAPIFTYLFTPLFDMIGKKSADISSSERFRAGALAVALAVVFSLRDIRLISLSLSLLIAFCLTLCVSKKYGAATGGITGAILGIACSSPVCSAVLGAVGVISGLMFPQDLYALLSAIPVAVVLSVSLGGVDGFLSTLPEIMAGFLILWPLLLKIPARCGKISEQRLFHISLSQSSAGERLEKMSGVFSGLSEVFFAVGAETGMPDRESARALVESACNGVCASCSASLMCWGKRWRDTNGVLDTLAECVIKNENVETGDFPDYFRERCSKTDTLCRAINRSTSAYCREKGRLDSANVIAGEYRTVSKLLKSTADTFQKFPEKNEEIAKKAGSVLVNLGIEFGFVEAWGGRNTVIDCVGVYPERVAVSTVELVNAFENACEMKFEEPEFIMCDAGNVMRLKRRRAIHLECAKNTCGKKGEATCGDTVTFFENGNGMFYSLLCDGMGSGREAALTSRLASVFLEKLLCCTEDKSVTVEMLNSMLISKDGESFTTLDLMEIDLYEMRASFIKAGAAPSYIYRDGKVYKINSNTPPAGIIDELGAEETRIKLCDGDLVLLVSDGVCDDSDSFPISDILSQNRTLSATDLSRKILSMALSHFSARDDMSVAVIRIFGD